MDKKVIDRKGRYTNSQNQELQIGYANMQKILSSSSHLIKTLNPMWLKYQKAQEHLLEATFQKEQGPKDIFILFFDEERKSSGEYYSFDDHGQYQKETLEMDFSLFLSHFEEGENLFYSNTRDQAHFIEKFPTNIQNRFNHFHNYVLFFNESILILAFDFSHPVNETWGEMIKGISLQLLLYRTIYQQNQKIREAFIYTSSALARAAEAKDAETGYHIHRVSQYSVTLAKSLSFSKQELEEIAYSSKMHDVGKINISHSILLKPGPLTREEFMEMENHTVYGVLILGDSPYLEMARTIALSHHERWDGTGYPYYLKGPEIPMAACIVSIADVYDALRSSRPYKPPFDHDKACRIILEGDGRVEPYHFHPDVLNNFRYLSETFGKIYENLS